MDENYNNNENQNYNSYEFTTPIDPAPVDHTIYQNRGPSPEPEKPKKEKKSSGIGRKLGLCAAMAATFGLIAGGVFLGVSAVGSNLLGLNRQMESSVVIPQIGSTDVASGSADSGETGTAAVSSDNTGEFTVAQVSQNCMPAMVAITNKSVQEIQSMFGYGTQNYESSGSGIIVDQNDQELLIATNNHVVSGANTLTVSFIDNQSVEATIKGTDAENDLAVVAVKIADIPAETLSAIKVIQIGDSDEMQVGDQVVAIGNALGYGQSVSSGWVSALNRDITIDGRTHSLMQTDAAINPGNSGGALLNMKGELIGINEAKSAASAVEGMGYAIPVSTATPILSELMSQTTRYKVDEDEAGYIGITCKELSSDFSRVYGIPAGVYVDTLVEGGPAEAAGMKRGDIITKFGGTSIASYKELTEQLTYYAQGEEVEITVNRADNGEYKEQTITVTLGSKADSARITDKN